MMMSEDVLTDSAISDQFKAFLDTPEYKHIVSSLAFLDKPKVTINFNNILTFEEYDLTQHFNNNIDQALESLKTAVSEKMLDTDILHENTSNTPDSIQIRIQNYDDPISLRDITTTHTKKMVVVNCVIAKASEEKPYMTKSVYLCPECGHHQPSPKNTIVKKCPSCENEKMILDTSKCVFESYRNIVIQDLPEDLPAGHIPASKNVTVFGDDLTQTDVCRPGSRVRLTAIVRLDYDKSTLDDIKDNNDPLGILEAASTGTTFSLSLTANNIEPLGDTDTLSQHRKLEKDDIILIQKYKGNPELSNILLSSFAPHIYGHPAIKEVMLFALVSSTSNPEVNGAKKRGDINILLVGNAGVAKSQMMLFAAKISPRCIYVSGRGSSGVGLTAAVTKDEKTGAMMLEAGATVLADQGVCIIDEFDKLRTDDRSALHEVMEQQTCSIAKGGIVATLNARTSILAASNPLTGTYNSYQTLAENTGFPPSLISRFDFLFVIKDVVDEQHDTDIANIILTGESSETDATRLDTLTLSKYIQYCKSLPDPGLTKEASKLIKDHYIALRKHSEQDKDGTVSVLTVTARLVDTLKRASIARAKLLQKDMADVEDVHKVISLLNQMYRSFGVMIPESEDIDLDNNVKNIETRNLGLLYGKPLSKLSKKKVFLEVCEGLTQGRYNTEIYKEHLLKELMTTHKFVTVTDAEDTINQAIREGVLSPRGANVYTYDKDVVRQ
jgi:replicative DNA helicase Mcm